MNREAIVDYGESAGSRDRSPVIMIDSFRLPKRKASCWSRLIASPAERFGLVPYLFEEAFLAPVLHLEPAWARKSVHFCPGCLRRRKWPLLRPQSSSCALDAAFATAMAEPMLSFLAGSAHFHHCGPAKSCLGWSPLLGGRRPGTRRLAPACSHSMK